MNEALPQAQDSIRDILVNDVSYQLFNQISPAKIEKISLMFNQLKH